jgi:hypothetical protein
VPRQEVRSMWERSSMRRKGVMVECFQKLRLRKDSLSTTGVMVGVRGYHLSRQIRRHFLSCIAWHLPGFQTKHLRSLTASRTSFSLHHDRRLRANMSIPIGSACGILPCRQNQNKKLESRSTPCQPR